MKTLAKIFMAVVAGMLAFSCVTDTTEDLGVNLGEGQSTTIGISLEDSRTHITGKDGEEYPMYWSKGDKIAVNGKASEALAEEYHGQQKALFTVNALLGYPRAIVYPAPAEGVKAQAEGCQVVTFPSVQAHNANSFAEGAVPMYGYVDNEGASTQLNHLAGVLRFLVQCGDGVENTTLKSMVVEVNHGSIAGNFDVDCANGTLTAHADAINTVTVSFGEGLAVTAEPTPVYVSVPAGEYGTVSVTLYTDNSSFTASFSSFNNENGDKSIKAGNVREFSDPIVYVPSAVNGTFLIYDEASLRNFASRVSEADFATTYPTATVVANIDLTGKEWTPIEGYTGTFDGLNHKIIGLSAPLFKETTSTSVIKNVKLTNVNIESTDAIVGALVCYFKGTEMTNCSVSGAINVDLSNTTTFVAIGGIAGVIGNWKEDGEPDSSNSNASNLVNNVNINVEGDSTSNTSLSMSVGGVSGRAHILTATNCTNNGNVTVASDFKTGIGTSKGCYIAGTFGYTKPGSATTWDNIVNTGNVTVGGTYPGVLKVGGCAGHFAYTHKNTVLGDVANSGDITISANTSVGGRFDCGGLAGTIAIKSPSSEEKEAVNSGNVNIESGLTVGGLAYIASGYGWTDKAVYYVATEGALTVNGATFNDAAYIGGTIAYSSVKNNYLTMSESSSITVNGGTFNKAAYIAGAIAYVAGQGAYHHLYGDITIKGDENNPLTFNDNTYIAGNVGCSTSNIAYAYTYSSSSIKIEGGKFGTYAYIAGNVAFTKPKANDFENASAITVDGGTFDGALYIGGNVAWSDQNGTLARLKNSGAIQLNNSTLGDNIFILGGCVATFNNDTGGSATTLTNEGAISINSKTKIKGQALIGGCLGRMNKNGVGTITESTNDAPITVKAEIYDNLYVGGVGAYVDADGNDESLTNTANGDILIEATECATEADNRIFNVGGVVARLIDGSINTTNSGAIEVKGSYQRNVVVGGVIGNPNNYWRTRATNNGDITIDAQMTGYCLVGGICAGTGDKTFRRNINTGNITFTENSWTKSYAYIGGLFGKSGIADTNLIKNDDGEPCSNSGTITFSGKNGSGNDDGVLYIGGLAGQFTAINKIEGGFENSGSIIFNGEHNGSDLCIGGIAGNNEVAPYKADGTRVIDDTLVFSGEKIECSGTITKGTPYIGGIFGCSTQNIVDAKVFTNISAVGFTNVGMITGSARVADTVVASNCAVGGSICTSMIGQGEDAQPRKIELSATNYFNYIYGSADWTGTADYDGCTFEAMPTPEE